jgi:aldose 1-epimerase
VAGSALDFREPRLIGDTLLDYAYTGLERDGDGLAWVELRTPEGWSTRLWADGHYPFLQLFSGDTLAPERRRRGLGVEPMTAAPNAFRSGDGLVVLEPDETRTMAWGIQPG